MNRTDPLAKASLVFMAIVFILAAIGVRAVYNKHKLEPKLPSAQNHTMAIEHQISYKLRNSRWPVPENDLKEFVISAIRKNTSQYVDGLDNLNQSDPSLTIGNVSLSIDDTDSVAHVGCISTFRKPPEQMTFDLLLKVEHECDRSIREWLQKREKSWQQQTKAPELNIDDLRVQSEADNQSSQLHVDYSVSNVKENPDEAGGQVDRMVFTIEDDKLTRVILVKKSDRWNSDGHVLCELESKLLKRAHSLEIELLIKFPDGQSLRDIREIQLPVQGASSKVE